MLTTESTESAWSTTAVGRIELLTTTDTELLATKSSLLTTEAALLTAKASAESTLALTLALALVLLALVVRVLVGLHALLCEVDKIVHGGLMSVYARSRCGRGK